MAVFLVLFVTIVLIDQRPDRLPPPHPPARACPRGIATVTAPLAPQA